MLKTGEMGAKKVVGGILLTFRPLSTFTPAAAGAALGKQTIDRIARTERDWKENPRWRGINRRYTAEDVERVRGSVDIEYTLAKRGADRLWNLLHNRPFVKSLGALTGNQAMQQVKAGLESIYVSGWQVAADANESGKNFSLWENETKY
jgi:isocitrate lyase